MLCKKEWTRQELMKLAQDLNSLCEKLDLDFDVNSGGCCYLAYKIATKLKSRHIGFTLLIGHYGEFSDDYVRRVKSRSFEDREDAYPHYFIEITSINAFINYSKEYPYIDEIDVTPSDIKYILERSEWNNLYCRSHNRTISKLINNFFDVL